MTKEAITMRQHEVERMHVIQQSEAYPIIAVREKDGSCERPGSPLPSPGLPGASL